MSWDWQRSSGDDTSSFSDLAGAADAASTSDTTVPAGVGRYYRVVLSAGTGVSPMTTGSDRGYRARTPTVTTDGSTDITPTTATISGSVSTFGAPSLTGAGLCTIESNSASDCAGPSPATPCGTGWTRTTVTTPVAPGSFDAALTALTPAADHRYCAYAANLAGVAHGSIAAFTTEPEPVCGDDVVTYGEECDDGNLEDGDDCGATCLVEDCHGAFMRTGLGPAVIVGSGCGGLSAVTGSACAPFIFLPTAWQYRAPVTGTYTFAFDPALSGAEMAIMARDPCFGAELGCDAVGSDLVVSGIELIEGQTIVLYIGADVANEGTCGDFVMDVSVE